MSPEACKLRGDFFSLKSGCVLKCSINKLSGACGPALGTLTHPRRVAVQPPLDTSPKSGYVPQREGASPRPSREHRQGQDALRDDGPPQAHPYPAKPAQSALASRRKVARDSDLSHATVTTPSACHAGS